MVRDFLRASLMKVFYKVLISRAFKVKDCLTAGYQSRVKCFSSEAKTQCHIYVKPRRSHHSATKLKSVSGTFPKKQSCGEHMEIEL